MAIIGAHMLVYTPEAEAVRAVLRDVLGWQFVEEPEGSGWLIFKLPPAELGVHPSGGSTKHELCLMCDDIEATIAELAEQGVECRGTPVDESFGITTTMLLPGGVEVLLYQPKHTRAIDLP